MNVQQGGDHALHEDLRRLLELSDNLRVLLTNKAAGDPSARELAKSLLQDNPQIVVVGMQSAGKSSVLERLSGIKFPRAAGMCTRAIIELRLRRGPKLDPIVRVRGPDFEKAFSSGDTAQDIKDAQDTAVSTEGSTIAKKYRVEIECQDEERPNVTIVDLPGVFNPDCEEDRDTANVVHELARQYAEMENSTVLHVMQINVDPAVVATKVMVNSLPKGKVVTVLTKPDVLDTSKPETASLVADYVERMQKPQFIVYGLCDGSSSEEEEYIHGLNLFSGYSNIGIGSRNLAKHLEALLAERLRRLLPALKQRIVTELRKVVNLLEGQYAELDPGKIVKRIRREILPSFPFKTHEKNLRHLYENMRVKVRGCRIKPINGNSATSSYEVGPIHDLEVGDTVFIQKTALQASMASETVDLTARMSHASVNQAHIATIGGSYSGGMSGSPCTPSQQETWCLSKNRSVTRTASASVKEAIITSEQVLKCTVKDISESSVRVLPQSGGNEVVIQQVFVPSLQTTLVKEIQDEYDQRGCQNIEFKGTQPILESYMARFSDDYSRELEKVAELALKETLDRVKEMIAKLKETVGESGIAVIEKIQELLIEASNSLCDNLKQAFERIGRYCKPPLVFTTNDHYLSQNITKSRVRNLTDASSSGPPNDERVKLREIYELIGSLEAFWKVKCKQVTECAASELVLIFMDDLEKALAAIEDQVDDLRYLVCDPPGLRLKRAELTTQKDLLEKALQLFKKL